MIRVANERKIHFERKMIHKKQKAATIISKKGNASPSKAMNHHSCGGRNALQQASKKRQQVIILRVMKSRLLNFLKTGAMIKITNVRLQTPF
jgi:hypothetical protein